MAKEYKKENIVNTYYEILILDACGSIYDYIYKNDEKQPFRDINEPAKKIIKMMKTDKELGEKLGGKWSYRIAKHEEDDDTDWQTIYKLYKYRGVWKYKVDERF